MSARPDRKHSALASRRRAAGVVAAIALAATAMACGADGVGSGVLAPHTPVTGTNGGTSSGGTSGTSSAAAAALVGQWFRLVSFTDSTGVRTSETTWEFRGDGTATRSVVARILATGFSSGVVTNATWSLTGATLSVTLLPAGTGGGSTSGGGLPPVTGNPSFRTDTTQQATTVSFAMRIDSTSTAGSRTLFLDEQPYLFVGPPATRP